MLLFFRNSPILLFRQLQSKSKDTSVADLDLELRGGGGGSGLDLLALLAFFPSVIPSVISSSFTQNKGGGGRPLGPLP